MILLLNTSTPICRLTCVAGDTTWQHEWQADRQLAKGLLGYLQERLAEHGTSWHDVTGLGVYTGPGSFTGLRIGLTVMNTLADGLGVPIVGTTGDGWQQQLLERLRTGQNDKIVLPEYGASPNITHPRK